MSDPAIDARARTHEAWLVLFGCLALAFALYRPALDLYFVGDDVAFVHPDPHWLKTAFVPVAGFHYYPLTQMLLSLLARAARWNPAPMHALNLLLHAAVGFGLYLWLRVRGVERRACLIAPFFFVARGVDYEVVTWITELSYLVVVVLTLLTLDSWDRYLRGAGGRHRALTVVGFALGLMTIEHALVLVPLYLAWDLIMRRERSLLRDAPTSSSLGAWTRATPRILLTAFGRYLPFALVIVAFLAIKLSTHHGLLMSSATGPPAAPAPVPSGMDLTLRLPPDRNWLGFLNTPRRATLDLLNATSYVFLPAGLCFGAEDTWLTRHPGWVLVPWLLIQMAIVWKGRPLTRFLMAWIYLYLVPLSVFSVPQARYYYMETVPAAALVGLGVAALSRRLEVEVPARAVAVATVLLLVALIAGEARFIRARLDEWKVAAGVTRVTVETLRRDVGADVREVYLVNAPRAMSGPFWPAYMFTNAAEHLPAMLLPPRRDVTVQAVYDRSFVGERWPTFGAYLSRERLGRALEDPHAIGYEFASDPPRLVPLGRRAG
jgi:hypothetical protein